MSVTIQNVLPTQVNQVRWQVDRDRTDTWGSEVPPVPEKPTLGNTSGTQTSVVANTPGNFRLIAYVDSNGNGSFDEGEQLAVLRFAIVRVTVLAPSNVNLTNTLMTDGANGVLTNLLRDFSQSPMVLTVYCLLEGGGGGRTVGTALISTADVGNLVAPDTFTVSYPVPTPAPPPPGNVIGTEAETPEGKAPIVDTKHIAVDGTSTDPTRASQYSMDEGYAFLIPPPPQTGGTTTGWFCADDPTFAWDKNHPITNNVWGSTSGSNQFTEYVVAYSLSFRATYVAVGQAPWTVAPVGTSGFGLWGCAGCSITGAGGATGQIPIQGFSGVFQAWGPSLLYGLTMVPQIQ